MMHTAEVGRRGVVVTTVEESSPTRQAYHVLHVIMALAPAIAGVDKFLMRLTNWDQYLAAPIADRLATVPIQTHHFMMLAGIVEVVLAFLVAMRPKIGGLLLAGWMLAIVTNLVIGGHFLDIALRDLGLFAAAIAVSRMATAYERVTELD